MKRDLGRLWIDGIIVHDVPRRLVRDEEDEGLVLSEVESRLTEGLRNYFRERIITSLSTAALDVRFHPEASSPAPSLIFDGLGPRARSFVTMSRELAEHLYHSQTGVNPPGLLTVAYGSFEQQPALAVLKLEREAGVRVRQEQIDGRSTFSVEHLQDLMLTQRTKVFKAGLFVQRGDDLEAIEGLVSDNQRSFGASTEVAAFFLDRFLGCRPRESADMTTKKFFELSQAFINEQIVNPETKARYHLALLASVANQELTQRPAAFAEQNFDSNDRMPYREFIELSGIPAEFDKNVSLIEKQIRKTQLDFESGLALLGSPSTFEQHVTIEGDENGQTRVEIRDRLSRVRGR